MYEDWPQGRGVFVSADYRLAVWVNAEDHLRIITTHTKPEIAFHLAMSALKALQATLAFEFDCQLGYICPSPANLGTAMDVELHMRVDRPLTPELAARVQENYGVIVKSARDDDSVVIARNELKVGITEVQTMLSVISGSVEVTKALRDSDAPTAGETKA
jgi:protein-arginine kinase